MGEAKRKEEQFRAYKSCVYCGAQCRPTMDHVPPKGIFPPPRPTIMITVPACQKCNEDAAQIDEAFKAAIAIQIDPKRNSASYLLSKAGLSTLHNNRRLFRELFSETSDVLTVNECGNFQKATTFLWPEKYHDAVISRITKGLYFHETRTSLFDLDCDVTVRFHGRNAGEIPELARTMNMRSVGMQQFAYSFGVAAEDKRRSLWLYEFYETHYASAETFPRGEPLDNDDEEPIPRQK
ncbi:hypothetical protein EN814_09770 [Mesorhizobium sp. M2D.F.Ca.ET.171.01.1.1]|uniref:hypothetical protein n=1 Tax=unclassified Mesorhizobium TaxID=325217 RepID=UPI001092D697|nr:MULTISPECIES: hypothetical protein [unclassified Mesorhizobium]TGS97471.1 hypothetical protein EN821_09765 [Mesorhizobium sp. M2D.F.Ca.ET.178.01.1.1]TGT12042.1 hypothetical protein EN814_09770 [Mesorhizobium sp. M2D.F.Ca.ET.171.01.1.1]